MRQPRTGEKKELNKLARLNTLAKQNVSNGGSRTELEDGIAMSEFTYQYDIFLSYASEDRERIRLLVERLMAKRWTVWWDQRIPTGREYDEFIEEQLDTSRSVVVVWSSISVTKRWVKTEAGEGLSRKVLFPVMIDQVKIPLEFRRVQAANLTQWQGNEHDEAWEKLIHDLTTLLGEPATKASFNKKNIREAKPRSSKEGGRDTPQQGGKKIPAKSREVVVPSFHENAWTHPIPNGMVLIPTGPFLYGDEKREVTIDHDYYMDVHPVTNAAYRKFIEAGGYDNQTYWSQEGWQWQTSETITQPTFWDNKQFNGPDQPVVGVSYYEAEAYATWAGKRLPTEQEWEKAARGTDGREYPWGEEFDADRCANSVKGERKQPTPVGTFPEEASPFGCQDMAGNVVEWCASWFNEKKEGRVLRGGAWFLVNPEDFRCAVRDYYDPRDRDGLIGFRCAQDAP